MVYDVSWPADFAERYRRAGYWTGEPLGDLLTGWAARWGSRIALVDRDLRLGYDELDHRSHRLAAGLAARGIRAGDNVVVQLPNVASFVVLCFALFRLGAAPVLALPAHRRHEISYLCATSGAVAYFVPDRHQGFDYRELAAHVLADAPTVREVYVDGEPGPYVSLSTVDASPRSWPTPDPGAVALFLLSGGTTGAPKLIPRTHDDYVYNFRASAANAGLDTSSVYLAALPVAHNFALGCPGVLGTFEAGGRVVMAPSPSPDEAFPLIDKERVTFSALVPALAVLWTRMAPVLPYDLSSLRLLQIGGSKLDVTAARRITPTFGCRLQQSFGLAEGLLSQARVDDPPEVLTSTQGRPISPADEIRIVDEHDNAVVPGEVGELLVRGPYTIRGYYRAGNYNQQAFTADGFFRTGDLARQTPEGNLVIHGRRKDVVNRGGEKVPAGEVEDHLLAHPSVSEAAVVAMPDPVMGERTCAYVVPTPGAKPTLTVLADFIRDRDVAPFKIPDRLELVTSLPKTAVGKIDKSALRARIAATVARGRGHGVPA